MSDENAEAQSNGDGGAEKVPVVMGSNGRPMTFIKCSIGDKVPTVKYGDVYIGVTMHEFVENVGDGLEQRQNRIDRARELSKDCQFVVGVERRLLQWALDPSARVESPIDAQAFSASSTAEVFANPPAGYDATRVHDPRPPEVPAAPPAAPPEPTVAPGVQLG